MSEQQAPKTFRFPFAGTKQFREMGMTITVPAMKDGVVGMATIKIIRELTVQQVYALNPQLYNQVVRNVPPGVQLYWYEGEAEECQVDTNQPRRTADPGTN